MSRKIIGASVGTPLNPQALMEKVSIDSKADAIVTSASGEVITTTDSAKAKPKNIRLYGKTEQDSTEGNQLFDKNTVPLLNELLQNDGTPSPSPNISFAHTDFIEVLPNETYTIACLDSKYISTGIYSYDDNKTFISIDKTYTGFVTPTNTKYIMIVFCKSTYDTFTNEDLLKLSDNIMLVKGSTKPTVYELYTGVQPSPNMNYPQPTKNIGEGGSIVGKVLSGNVFNYKEVVNNFRNKNYVQLTSGYNVTSLQFKPNTEYYMKVNGIRCTWTTFLISTQQNVNGSVGKAVGVSNTWDSEKCVTTDETGLIYFGISNPVDNQLDRIEQSLREALVQIEIGSSATPYKPYTEQQFTVFTPNGLKGVPLGTTIPNVIKNSPIHMAGVYWDNTEGKYYISDTKDYESGKNVQRIKGYVVDGSIRMYTYDSMKGFTLNLESLGFPSDINRASFVNQAIPHKTIWVGQGNSFVYLLNNQYYDETLEDKGMANLKAHLNENPLVITTWLDEPIETDLTEEEMAQYNALHMNYPNTTIINNENAYMEVEYVADTKMYIDNKFKQLEMALANTNSNLL